MTVNRSFILAALLALCSCTDPQAVDIPDAVLPVDSMVDVLTDMHLVEGAKMGRRIMGDTLKVDDYYLTIFEKYKISKERLDSSYIFYSSHPKLMDEIYDSVLVKLNELEVAAPRWDGNMPE